MADPIRDLITANELDPTTVGAHQHHASAHIELGDHRAANVDLRQAN